MTMRIAMNVTRDYVAGITSSNINILNTLLGNDHEMVGIEVTGKIHLKSPIIFRSFAPETFDHHTLNLHHLPINQVVKKSRTLRDVEVAYKPAIALIRGILRETKPDCMLLNGTYFIPWLIALAARAEGIPVVLWYAGVLTRETEHYPARSRRIFKSMEQSMVRQAKKIIFPSDLCRKEVEERVAGKRLRNSYVVPNPITPIFTEQSAAEPSLERRIAAVGRYSPVKNFDAYFSLHRRLLKEKWLHTASFVTSTEKIPRMPRTVRIAPPMTQEGLKRFYLTQGLIICPSTFETFGNVPMEAACLGIPVLVNKTMGCADILRQAGLSNMIADFTNEDEVVRKVKELCGQYILPRQLNALRKLLDYRFIGSEIEGVLKSSIK
ncbi:MAG TPA: glycosyltransferase family 4 protein [Candidatus Paceibacterota bacterium]